jgi:hypothetical protein
MLGALAAAAASKWAFFPALVFTLVCRATSKLLGKEKPKYFFEQVEVNKPTLSGRQGR